MPLDTKNVKIYRLQFVHGIGVDLDEQKVVSGKLMSGGRSVRG